MTPCHIPFRDALENAAWSAFQQRFTNQTDCTHCKREFTQDTEDRRWYPSDAIMFGADPDRADEVQPITTQQGWFCGEDCRDEHLVEIGAAA